MKHTPGPWMKEGPWITGNEGETLAQVYSEYEADARLIAAAPEMLEALIDACRTIQWEKGVKAIEKATGKTWEEIKEEEG
jgi:hypothetical protein